MPANTIDFALLDDHFSKQSKYLTQRRVDIDDAIARLVDCKTVIDSVVSHIEAVRIDIHHLACLNLPAEALQYETKSKFVPESP